MLQLKERMLKFKLKFLNLQLKKRRLILRMLKLTLQLEQRMPKSLLRKQRLKSSRGSVQYSILSIFMVLTIGGVDNFLEVRGLCGKNHVHFSILTSDSVWIAAAKIVSQKPPSSSSPPIYILIYGTFAGLLDTKLVNVAEPQIEEQLSVDLRLQVLQWLYIELARLLAYKPFCWVFDGKSDHYLRNLTIIDLDLITFFLYASAVKIRSVSEINIRTPHLCVALHCILPQKVCKEITTGNLLRCKKSTNRHCKVSLHPTAWGVSNSPDFRTS